MPCSELNQSKAMPTVGLVSKVGHDLNLFIILTTSFAIKIKMSTQVRIVRGTELTKAYLFLWCSQSNSHFSLANGSPSIYRICIGWRRAKVWGDCPRSIFYPGDEASLMICVRQMDGPKPKRVDSAWWWLTHQTALVSWNGAVLCEGSMADRRLPISYTLSFPKMEGKCCTMFFFGHFNIQIIIIACWNEPNLFINWHVDQNLSPPIRA